MYYKVRKINVLRILGLLKCMLYCKVSVRYVEFSACCDDFVIVVSGVSYSRTKIAVTESQTLLFN